MTFPQRLSITARLSNCNLATWVAVKTSVNSCDHPTFEMSLYFLNFRGFGDHAVLLWNSLCKKWAVLKRSFISQGRKELLTPPSLTRLEYQLTRGDSSILFTRASLRWLTHLRDLLTRTFLWPPPFLLHKRRFIAWFKWEKTIKKKGNRESGIAFKISLGLQGFGISWPTIWWIKHRRF